MSGNYFDRFDDAPREATKPKGKTAGGNYFDRFDAKPKAKPSVMEDVTGFMANVNRGLGIGDEIAAAGQTAVNALTGRTKLQDVPADFKRSMAAQRQVEDSFAADRPRVAALAKGTGNALTMATPAGPGAAAFATGGRAINAARGATVAGLSAAGYAAVDRGSASERIAAASDAAKDPLTLALGGAAGAIAAPGRAKPARVSVDDLRAEKDAAYQAVDAAGERFSADDTRALTAGIMEQVKRARFNERLHPKTAAMLDQLSDLTNQKAGYEPTLSELDELRQVIGRDVASSSDAGERRMGTLMMRELDRFIDQRAAGEGAETIKRARNLNTRVKKLEAIDEAIDDARKQAGSTGSGGNINNATRQALRRVAKKTKNLTPAEAEAFERAVVGTPGQNVLRQVGKLSPEGNGLMLGAHLLSAAPTGGASTAVAGVGALSKRAADYLTTRNVQKLRELIAVGGDEALEVIRQVSTQPQYADLRQQLANDLAVQSGVQGASARAPIEITVGSSTHPDHLAWRRANGR